MSIRRLKPGTLQPYRQAAAANGRSLEAELRDVIERNRPRPAKDTERLLALSRKLRAASEMTSDSTAYLRWSRDTNAGRLPGSSPFKEDDAAPQLGGCQCGKVRYSVEGPTPVVYACHCRECQKQSASAFGLSLPVARESLAVFGRLESWERGTQSGSLTRCFFCPACGTRLFHASDRSPDRVTVKAGSLDDTSRLRPVAHIWVSRKQPWVVLDPEVPAHDTQPADLAGWRAAMVGENQ